MLYIISDYFFQIDIHDFPPPHPLKTKVFAVSQKSLHIQYSFFLLDTHVYTKYIHTVPKTCLKDKSAELCFLAA